MRMTRRDLMIQGAVAAAGILSRSSIAGVSAADSKPAFRIGACDWTLGLRASPKSLEMAARLGLDGVQVDLGDPDAGLPVLGRDVQSEFLEASRKQKVAIASLAIGALNDVPYKSDPRAERWVADSIGACKSLGTRVILLAFFGKGDLRNDAKGTDAVIQRLKQVTPEAEKAGVVFGFESWLSAKQHMEILNRVGSEALKVYYDVANSHKEGYDIYREIRFLGRNICEFHAKDYDGLYGKGSINFKEVRKAMDEIDYRGWIQMEGVQMPLGIEESCRYDLAYLRSVFSSKQ